MASMVAAAETAPSERPLALLYLEFSPHAQV